MTLGASGIAKRISHIEESRRRGTERQITIDDTRMTIHARDQDKIYVPTNTGHVAHDDDSFVRVIMGPYGSGKSTWAATEIVRRAAEMPRWYANRRRSRWGIVRNTSGELSTTTLATWLSWFEDLGDVRKRQKPILTYEHSFNDGFGIVELELLFIALDRPEDVRKIKSLELTGCYINELSEVPKAALAHMKGRVNRYPSKAFCHEPYWSGIIADTNPPEDDHWIYKDFEENRYEGHILFKQPPGLIKDEDDKWVRNPQCDNFSHLPADYYEKLAHGQSQEFVKVFCLGEYGSVGFGKRVYSEFNPDFHAVESLVAMQGQQLILGWDFGLTPACVVLQLSPRGQLLILKEYVGDGMGIRTFADSIVIPSLLKDFPYCKVGELSIGDPAGNARNEIVEEMSCIGELNSLGIPTRGARTNDIDPRLASVRYFLNKMVDGKPGLVLDRRACPALFKGFVKEYVYARVAVSGEERYKEKPNKNMSSHPMDALGYACLEIASDRITSDKMEGQKTVDMFNPVMRIF
ncbi:MAG TPA: phage terminase large subunit [Candidatus Brocadiaceae bacterium]